MPSPHDATTDRRTVLAGVAAGVGSLGLSGCLDATDGEETNENANDTTAENTTHDDDASEADANSSDDDEDTESADDDEESAVHEGYESIDVRVTTPDGEELGEVTAAIADTDELRWLGLSDTEELPDDRGMLFVYDEVDDRTFGMPDMSFGIDIVFADDEGVITSIAHAPEPEPDEDGSEHIYPGRGQYVLEVAYEWTAERGVEQGDVLEFEL